MQYFFKRLSQFITLGVIFILIILFIQKTTYQISGGDLNRIGKVSFPKRYKKFYDSNEKLHYADLADINLKEKPDIDILIFGDSFCKMGRNGLPNYLAKESGKNIINTHFDYGKLGAQHPLEAIYLLLNGGFFDSTKVRYVLLQSVVRNWNKMLSRNENAILKYESFIQKKPYPSVSSYESYLKIHSVEEHLNFFQKHKRELDNSIKFILFNFLYIFNHNAFGLSPIHVFKLDKNLFSEKNNILLVLGQDINNMKGFNLIASNQLNEKLNTLANNLSKKNIKLIFVPTANKYDIYHSHIQQTHDYKKSNYFQLFKNKKKEYIYIDTDEILTNVIKSGELDLYLADDSHWSHKAADIVSKNILSKINLNY